MYQSIVLIMIENSYKLAVIVHTSNIVYSKPNIYFSSNEHKSLNSIRWCWQFLSDLIVDVKSTPGDRLDKILFSGYTIWFPTLHVKTLHSRLKTSRAILIDLINCLKLKNLISGTNCASNLLNMIYFAHSERWWVPWVISIVPIPVPWMQAIFDADPVYIMFSVCHLYKNDECLVM